MKPITIERIKQDLETAAYVDRLLPPVRLPKYRCWLFDIVYTPQEIAFMDVKPLKVRPTQAQIALWERVVLDWMTVLEPRERKIVWKRAKLIPWKYLCRDFGVSRNRLVIIYDKSLIKIQFFLKGRKNVNYKKGGLQKRQKSV
jgi:hypothetical protein